MYGCDFGWGKAVDARSGTANKTDGETALYPGRDGGGSVDAELMLTPEHMAALKHDDELWLEILARNGDEGRLDIVGANAKGGGHDVARGRAPDGAPTGAAAADGCDVDGAAIPIDAFGWN
uniref:Uncharacterized protein n=1 Tax=Oryza brachyantha TaxID=4533 RepID=J3LIW8_ORYBR